MLSQAASGHHVDELVEVDDSVAILEEGRREESEEDEEEEEEEELGKRQVTQGLNIVANGVSHEGKECMLSSVLSLELWSQLRVSKVQGEVVEKQTSDRRDRIPDALLCFMVWM